MSADSQPAVPNDRLGGRFPLYDPASLTGAAKTLYDHARTALVPAANKAGFIAMLDDGRLVGPFNPMLASPEISTAMLELQKVEAAGTSLGKVTRQVVILSVGAIWKAPYELYAHSAEARAVGLSAETIAALTRGDPTPALDDGDLIAQKFTLALVGERKVDDALFTEARDKFGEKGIVDLIVLAGCYQVICSLLNAITIPVPASDGGDDAGR